MLINDNRVPKSTFSKVFNAEVFMNEQTGKHQIFGVNTIVFYSSNSLNQNLN